jgi:hypothetical protein
MVVTDFKNLALAEDIAAKIEETKKTLTPANILDFVLLAMKMIEPHELEGKDKKRTVYLIMLKLINSLKDDQIKERRFIQVVLDNVFDSFVENTITVSKNPKDFFYKARPVLEKIKNIFKIFNCKKRE